jgi:hypothetical protein
MFHEPLGYDTNKYSAYFADSLDRLGRARLGVEYLPQRGPVELVGRPLTAR